DQREVDMLKEAVIVVVVEGTLSHNPTKSTMITMAKSNKSRKITMAKKLKTLSKMLQSMWLRAEVIISEPKRNKRVLSKTIKTSLDPVEEVMVEVQDPNTNPEISNLENLVAITKGTT